MSAETIDAVLATTRYEKADVTDAEELGRLFVAAKRPGPVLRAAPGGHGIACTALKALTLPTGTTLALEKPFGTDDASAASSTSC